MVRPAQDVLEVCRLASRAIDEWEQKAKQIGDSKALIGLREQRSRVVQVMGWAVTELESPGSAADATEISDTDSKARKGRR